MSKLSTISLLVAALLPPSLVAKSIEGTVVNKAGKGIANASIEVEGTDIRVLADNNGHFQISGVGLGNKQIHVRAPGFAHLHKALTLEQGGVKNAMLMLNRSPIEVIDIVATPVHMSAMESAVPVSVLAGETLRRQQTATLGNSLEKLPGVNTNFHAKVASTPIIRGLSGPRVLVTQNGLDVSDVSRVGPDHSVASEASTAQQIEVLRGPATLFYGSGAIVGPWEHFNQAKINSLSNFNLLN